MTNVLESTLMLPFALLFAALELLIYLRKPLTVVVATLAVGFVIVSLPPLLFIGLGITALIGKLGFVLIGG